MKMDDFFMIPYNHLGIVFIGDCLPFYDDEIEMATNGNFLRVLNVEWEPVDLN